MPKKSYPYTAWVLTASFNPKQVVITGPYQYGAKYGDQTGGGKLYQHSDLHPDLPSAVRAGWAKIYEQQADIDKRQDRLNKRKAALIKATSEVPNSR